ncbi:MAG: acyltransferase family protein [Prevotella sp.]|jgi:surface polysaccharide O-acyltransferase-like enzyme|nr:acyltransferase family protein [Prevotella sp.]
MMERNLGLDYFRVILSILVITPHAQPLFEEDSLVGWLISNGIARIVVPCFFIISGYFLSSKLDDKKALKKYLLHLLLVYVVWSVIYVPVYYNSIEPRSFITFALMGYYHLWFLPALIIGVIMLILGNKLTKNKNILLASGIVLYIIGYIMENRGLPYRSFYNGIFFGYPFIVSGYFLKNNNIKDGIKNLYLYIIALFSLVTLLLESYLGYKDEIYHNVFLSLYIICPALFLLVIKNSHYTKAKDYMAKLAAGIYFIHILVLTAIVPLSEEYNIYNLPLIILVSVLLSIFIIFVNKRIKIFL